MANLISIEGIDIPSSENIEDNVIYGIAQEEFLRVLNTLRPAQSSVIFAVFYDGKTQKETSLELGISQQAVNDRLNAGIKNLHKRINRNEIEGLYPSSHSGFVLNQFPVRHERSLLREYQQTGKSLKTYYNVLSGKWLIPQLPIMRILPEKSFNSVRHSGDSVLFALAKGHKDRCLNKGTYKSFAGFRWNLQIPRKAQDITV